VIGGSAGAPSALQLAIRHPQRVSALILLVPLTYKPAGLRSDTAVGKHLAPAPLEAIHTPTLIVSARDDGYGACASAQYTANGIAGARFIGFDQGGHVWLGHNDEVMSEVVKLLSPLARP
jgi:pimeloyl-ACP methyl ester carboxylesterase